MITRRSFAARTVEASDAAVSSSPASSSTVLPTAAPNTNPPDPFTATKELSSSLSPSSSDLPSTTPNLSSSSSHGSPHSSPHSSPRLRPRHTKSRSSDRADLLVNKSNKWRSAYTRAYTTFLMLGGFVLLIYLGHLPLMALVFFLQVTMFKELKALSKVLSTKAALPSFRALHWYWFTIAVFLTYGKVHDYYFGVHTPYHTFLSFSMYCVGVLLFVWSLKRGYYKYQFETFAWIHLTLLLIVMQSTFVVLNMFHGLIWFILPALLIVSNDCWAYVFGFFFGRTPLIKLSPKKTWEGFVGAFVMTMVTGFALSALMQTLTTFTCPKTDLSFSPTHCVTPAVFLPQPYPLPTLLTYLPFIPSTIQVSRFQWHALSLSIFASLIAPFGGFFASGFKRAFRIKDFGESIPGHGGVTDRMDCQVLMGFFVWVYYEAFVVEEGEDERMGRVMKVVERMRGAEVERLYFALQDLLIAQGGSLTRTLQQNDAMGVIAGNEL